MNAEVFVGCCRVFSRMTLVCEVCNHSWFGGSTALFAARVPSPSRAKCVSRKPARCYFTTTIKTRSD